MLFNPQTLLLLSFLCHQGCFVPVEGFPFETGKLNISKELQGWSCRGVCSPTQHCHLPRCTNVAFPEAFSGSGKVQVHVTVSHGETFTRFHSPSAVWVQSLSKRGFEVCVREAGIGANGTGIINWLAFQDKPQMTHGSVAFKGVWTTETKCENVVFKQKFDRRPSVFISSRYSRGTNPDDAMYAWLENVNSRSFEVCIREFLPFDGKHEDTIVDWFAFHGNDSDWNFTLAGEAMFSESGGPPANANYGFCQVSYFDQQQSITIFIVHNSY